MNRRKTRKVYAGKLAIGGDSPISVQTMTNIPFADIEATIDQIYEIAEAGGELVRIAVPNIEFAKKVSKIVEKSPIPVSADIH
ncbi:flavodoxin-dependent (E)-4-hydroxy-3-methylbut-2-enyl-diphosphate synthase, partial [bacterium]|nr:flavodoxin-dependent (E)-4-hydroxy-3-methylbut-2-enyl-diphosphate synthase [bacterium]